MAPALFGIELAVLILILSTKTTDYFLEFFIIYLVVCAIINIITIIKLIMAFFWYALSNVRMC